MISRLLSRARPAALPALSLLPWAALVGMLAAGWGKRPDVFHDFGREVYLAWRVGEGDVLYRDLAHFNGPLSVWFNAAVLRLPGAGISTLLGVNVALLVLLLAVLQRLLARVAPHATAHVALTAFVVFCGAAHLTGIGGFDFVAPYAHEATHGTILAALALLAFLRLREAPTPGRAFSAGLLVGLTLLTKVEIALAIGLCLLAFLAVRGDAARLRPGLLGTTLLAGVAVAPSLALAALARDMPLESAARALALPWAAVLSGELSAEPFYRTVTGMSDLPGNALRLAVLALAEATLVAAAVLLARHTATLRAASGDGRLLVGAVFFAAAFFAGQALIRAWPGLAKDAFRTLPLAAVAALVAAFRRRASPEFLLSLFAAALCLKIAVRCGVHHYGFFLAAPALLTAVVLLLDGVPVLARLGAGARVLYRAAACGVLLALAAAAVARSVEIWSLKTVRVDASRPVDSFRADTRASAVNLAMRELRQLARPGETLSCLPEGTLVNYLLRMRNPSPYFIVLPPEVRLFGRSAIVESYRRSPPDWVLVHARRLEEYGVRTIGRDFLPELGDLLARRYRAEVLVGQDPLTPGGFGMLVFRRSGGPPDRSGRAGVEAGPAPSPGQSPP